jgi:hypothetical protein
MQITAFVHVGCCMPIPGFIDKATCFIFSPLLSPADVVAYTVRTGCHPTLYLLQGLGLHLGLTVPYPGFRSLISYLSATLPLPPNSLSPCHRTESSSSVSLPHVRLM